MNQPPVESKQHQSIGLRCPIFIRLHSSQCAHMSNVKLSQDLQKTASHRLLPRLRAPLGQDYTGLWEDLGRRILVVKSLKPWEGACKSTPLENPPLLCILESRRTPWSPHPWHCRWRRSTRSRRPPALRRGCQSRGSSVRLAAGSALPSRRASQFLEGRRRLPAKTLISVFL